MDAHKHENYMDWFKTKNIICSKKVDEILWVQDVEISKINICDESSTFIDIFRYCPHP